MASALHRILGGKFGVALLLFEIMVLFLYGFCTDYPHVDPNAQIDEDVSADGFMNKYYGFYMDIHVMIFVGFGFLVTFLHTYSMAAVALNFLVAACALQWSMLTNHFWLQINDGHPWHTIEFNVASLIDSDFAAGAALITFGGLVGKCSPFQLFVIMFIEMIFYSLNMWLGYKQLKAVDMGGSVIIHTFGAYFGLACSLAISRNTTKKWQDKKFQGATTVSDTMAMVGTLFLWVFWPSFNCAFAVGSSRHRVVINTVLSLTGAVVAAFMWSHFVRHHHKLSMVDIQNATLAGGVAIGGSADLVIKPYAALLVGFIAGSVSVLGYVYIQPFLERKIKLHDTAGVHNLHGMPGLIGGIAGVIGAASAGTLTYGMDIFKVFPARDPAGLNRSAGEQAKFQLASIGVTLAIALSSGYLTGRLVSHDFFEPPITMFWDPDYFHVEDEEQQHDKLTGADGANTSHEMHPRPVAAIHSFHV